MRAIVLIVLPKLLRLLVVLTTRRNIALYYLANIEIRQDPLSLDKYFESICSFQRIQLGINVNTRRMSLSLTDIKRVSMLEELSHWHKKKEKFHLTSRSNIMW